MNVILTFICFNDSSTITYVVLNAKIQRPMQRKQEILPSDKQ